MTTTQTGKKVLNSVVTVWFTIAVLGQWIFASYVLLFYGKATAAGHSENWNKQRIQNAQQLMLDGQLEPSDYKEIKNRFERIVTELNNKKRDLSLLDFNLPEYMTVSLEIVENLPKYFARADLKAKQQIIGSICPEKLIFENNSYRTKRVNEVLSLICSAGNTLSDTKKRLAPVFGSQSYQVPRIGFEPTRPCERCHLKAVRLPISPSGRGTR